MKLYADHVAGGFFVAVGAIVIALSGDLPFGQTSMPGAGFMPILIAVLLIVFGAALMLRAREGRLFSEVDWGDGRHAAQVLAITIVAIALYAELGFIITMILMMVAILLIIERRNILRAGAYSVVVVVATYVIFVHVLQSPLPGGILGY
jgi:hypothetical protein